MAHESQLTPKFVATCILALGLGLTGCVSVPERRDGKQAADCGSTAKNQDATHIVTRWHNEVAYAPDPTRGGAQIPGIVGRVYVFGPRGDYPLEGDGSLEVELFDAAVAEPKVVEKWCFDPATARKLQKEDAVGWGYSLFLPWSSYRKDLTHVQMRVSYKPAKATTALFSRSTPVHFGRDAPAVSSSAYTTGPAGTKVTEPQRIQTGRTQVTRLP